MKLTPLNVWIKATAYDEHPTIQGSYEVELETCWPDGNTHKRCQTIKQSNTIPDELIQAYEELYQSMHSLKPVTVGDWLNVDLERQKAVIKISAIKARSGK